MTALTTGQVLAAEFAAIHGPPATAPATEQDYREAVHALPGTGQAALCLSGGGIRSAAFSLGILQGLARHKLLSQFHYLSTVSGGGYIGGWLTAWAYRAKESGKTFDDVETELSAEKAAPPPLRELRRLQTFITPRTGIGSADSWAAIAHVLRNLLLNWLVFLPLLAALLLVPRIFEAWLLYWSQLRPAGWYPNLPGSFFHALWNLILPSDRLKQQGCSFPCFSAFGNGFDIRPWRGVIALGLVFWARAVARRRGWLMNGGHFRRKLLVPLAFAIAVLLLFGPLHFWLDLVAAIFVCIGVVHAMANRGSDTLDSIDDAGFQRRVLAPILLGAVLLLSSIGFWTVNDSAAPGLVVFSQWTILCGITFAAIRRIAESYITRVVPPSKKRRHMWLEMLAQGVAGMLVGALIWLGLRLRHGAVDGKSSDFADIVVFGLPWMLLCFLAGQILLAGLTSRLFENTGDRNREWLARASGWYLLVALAWLAFAATAIYGHDVMKAASAELTALTAGTGVLGLLGGASPLSKAIQAATGQERFSATTLTTLFSIIFGLCLLIWISHGTAVLLYAVTEAMPALGSWASGVRPVWLIDGLLELDPESHRQQAQWRFAWVLAAVILLYGLSWMFSRFINVNYFSLNGLYRNRLVRAFLGSSNIGGVAKHKPSRNPFDGFSPTDNPPMHEVWQGTKPNGSKRTCPFPVINTTLNLAATDNTAWQERKAAAFVHTPLHSGSSLVGYRPAREYADGLTLGTCMSISGAAANPNWGYHSSPITSFLMTLFNIRLGVWLGNPNSERHWRSDDPNDGISYFMREALGRTTDKSDYVNLSDGGHFENLGLYEMVRRRCRTIVVVDAGQDEAYAFADLGNAVRKIAIDLDVEIELTRIDMPKGDADPTAPGTFCAVGEIIYRERRGQYAAGTDRPGTLIYIKPGLHKPLPADVRSYAAANAKFPHDPTPNQWFTESQFESYRALGSHVVRMITRGRADEHTPLRLLTFVRKARLYVGRAQPRKAQ
ncbi:patatin-like phospholipase family protein [Teichococcus vastitatis]|uniref:Patatin-like phospholipase family protein n=1 Tax=Teichococcus vastitatis TaxID=2307076 RepID=A0ABS9W8W0_9PROT|nr:patatin-like phospholipase family protein [Pseudoroseomonas vastitatis]MCI0755749.1 patatin-like phospholipase family protein [Pseudoroseomonas vastitatis]